MARFAGTAAVSAIVGKAGQSVFYRGRNGGVIRVRVTGTNPQSARQTTVRTYLSNAAAAWQVLTSDEVASWEAYAKKVFLPNTVTGEKYNPTAYTAFMGLACKFQQINSGGTIPTVAPTTSIVQDKPPISWAITDTGTLTVDVQSISSTNISMELLYQPLPNGNRKGSASKWKSAGFHHFTTGDFDFIVQTVDLTAPFFKFAYRWVNSATGQETEVRGLSTEQNV